MKKYKLVKYTERDHDDYIKCQVDAFEKYVVEFFGKFKIDAMEKHLKLLKDSLFKIELDRKLAGFVYYKEEESKITVDVFTILPEFRNFGLGSQIIQDFIGNSKKLGKPIFLDTFKTNPAKKFYERHGFKVVDENFSHYILSYNPKE